MIKHTHKLVLAATATLLLGACSDEIHTADWYVANTHAQADKHTYCLQRPEKQKEPNCVAAAEAELIIQKGTKAIQEYLDSKGLKRAIKG